MNVKYDLVIDFARPSKSNTIMISEGDTNSRVCHFTLLNNKHPMSMSDVTVATVRGIKKDGSEIFGDAKILTDSEGHFINELEYTIPAAVTDNAGNVTMTITLLSTTSEQLTSFEFYLQVRNALYNEDDLVSESDLTGFRDLLNRALVAVKKVEDLTENDTLPNPYPIDIELEGVHYQYTGRNTVEVKISDMAYIAEDPVQIVDAIDGTAAATAAESAREAKEAAEEAHTSMVDAQTAERRAEGYATEAREAKNTVESAVGMAQAYSMLAEEGGLISEGWAKGTQNGIPVGEDSPYYRKNAEFYAGKFSIEDRLDSADSNKSLSANQGRILNDVKADKTELPTTLAELESDEDHRTVTDTQINNWNNGGSRDYEVLSNKPSINGEELVGNTDITLADLEGDTDHQTVSQAEKDKWNSGADVEWTQVLTEGTKIAEITINGSKTDVYSTSGGGGETGTTNYQLLENKPSINNVELNGNKTLTQLGIPEWAQNSTKPSYTATEVNAVPKTRTVNGKALSSNVSLEAKDIQTDDGVSIQKRLDELESFESITYKGTVATVSDLPTNAENGHMYYCLADKKHYVCVRDSAIDLYEWHEYHTFDDGYLITVENVKNDLTTRDAGYVLDARQGYQLSEDLNNYEQTTDEEIDGIKQSLAQLEDKVVIERYSFNVNVTTSIQSINVANQITDSAQMIADGYAGYPITLTDFSSTPICDVLHTIDHQINTSTFRIVVRGTTAKSNNSVRLVVLWIKNQ